MFPNFVIEREWYRAKFGRFRVRKLSGKPAFLTIADCESEARRIQLTDYALDLSPIAAESNVCRIQPDLLSPACRIAWLICCASPGVNLAANNAPLALRVPIFGLPTLFLGLVVNINVDFILVYVNNNCK